MEPSSVHLQKPSSPLGIFSDIHSKRFRFLLLRKTDYFHNSRIVLLNPEIYESALINLRIIIPVLQIVHSGFFIVVVTSVAERVGFSDGAGFAAGDAHDFSPAAILVFYYSLSGVVNQCNDIILQ